MATVTAALRMPVELAARYDCLAKATGRTKTFYMNEALTESIDRFEYEYGIMKKGRGLACRQTRNRDARRAGGKPWLGGLRLTRASSVR